MTNLTFGRIRDVGGLPDLVLNLAGEEGLNRLFQYQGLPIGLLENPDAPVLMRDLIALYQRAADIVGMRSFGLKASRDIEVKEHGPAGRYILQASSLLEALERFRAALPYHEAGSRLDIKTDGDALHIGYWNVHQHFNGWRHAGDFTLCLLGSLIGSYLGSDWRPLRIETCYVAGPWEQDHEDLFSAPVRYRCGQISIVLDRETVESNVCKHTCEPAPTLTLGDLARLQDPLPRDIVGATTYIVEHRLIDGESDLEGAAVRLGLGPRTMQRRLGNCGTSYRDVLLRCRMRRAKELLNETGNTVNQIGLDLGYAATPQFTRAFKSQVGCPPQEFRRQLAPAVDRGSVRR